jgi:mobilization protein NikA
MNAKRRRSEMVSVRFEPAEEQAIRKAAEAAGKNVSQYLRDAALREATGPRCAACGRQDDLAWVVIRGEQRPTLTFAHQPFVISGPYRWCGYRCGPCCMRDYGVFALGGSAA